MIVAMVAQCDGCRKMEFIPSDGNAYRAQLRAIGWHIVVMGVDGRHQSKHFCKDCKPVKEKKKRNGRNHERYRQALELRNDGYTYREIGEMLDPPVTPGRARDIVGSEIGRIRRLG